MHRNFQINKITAILIYVILLTVIIAVLVAYSLLPKSAQRIDVILLNQPKTVYFTQDTQKGGLHYAIDGEWLRVYVDGKIHYYPIHVIEKISIHP